MGDEELQLPPGFKMPRSFDEAMAQTMAFLNKLNEAAPFPRGIILHHSVPPNKAYVQWDTNGDMWVWNNPCVLDDLKWVSSKTLFGSFERITSMTPLGGIDVFRDHPYWAGKK